MRMKSLATLLGGICLFLTLLIIPFVEAYAKPVELKISFFMSPKHMMNDVFQFWAKKVEERTEGRVKMTIYPGGALGKAPDHYDMAASGIADICHAIHGYTTGRFPLTSVMDLPFLAPSARVGSRVLTELYQKFPEFKQEYRDVKVLWLWVHEPGQILTTKKPIHTLEDLKGLKIRSPGAIQAGIIKKLGAAPVAMPVPKLYMNLEKGVVDGAMIPQSAFANFRLYEVVKYCAFPNIYVMPFMVVMNSKAYNSLEPRDQRAIDDLSSVGRDKTLSKIRELHEKGLKVAKEAGVQMHTLPPDELSRWKEVLRPMHDKWVADMEAKGLPGKKVYDEAVRLIALYK